MTTTRRAALTPQQREVLVLVANGHTNAEAGQHLRLSTEAINTRLQHAYRTLGARDRAHAVALALRLGDLTTTDIHPIEEQVTE